jgi:hypothetical protein
MEIQELEDVIWMPKGLMEEKEVGETLVISGNYMMVESTTIVSHEGKVWHYVRNDDECICELVLESSK